MKIIVIGGGMVGTAISLQLVKEGNDVTVIDQSHEVLTEIANTCDVIGVVGNGADVSVLEKAGAENADLLLAVASSDEVNILACAAAHKMGTRHTIARVRNPEYAGLMQLMKGDMNLSLTINPELAAAKEIYSLLRFPAATKIDRFCNGRIELAQFVVPEESPLCGVTLNELRTKIGSRFLIGAVLRGEEAYIPSGNFVIAAEDVVCITAPDEDIVKSFKALDMYRKSAKDVLIVGGGRTTYYLEGLLEKSTIHSTVIEKDRERCREIAEAFPRCTVICDGGANEERLLENGIEDADAFLALGDKDEENAVMAMYAKSKEVPKVITLVSTLSYDSIFRGMGLDSVISPKNVTVGYILRYVRAMNIEDELGIEALYRLMEDKVEAIEYSVKEEIDGITGVPLKRLTNKTDALVVGILRAKEVLIPTGDDVISVGDRVVIVTTSDNTKTLKDIFKS